MPFTPVVPQTGLAGYRFVQRTYDAQIERFAKSPEVQREIDYFMENGAKANTVDGLMGDRRLLAVVLGAFGLDAEIDKRAFVRRVIEDGTIARDALANRLADPAFAEMSAFLGLGDLGGTLNLESTRAEIVERYRTRQFESAVGDVDVDVRLALNFERVIGPIAQSRTVETTGWFRILGNQATRSVVEGAYNLPDSFAGLDLDRQVEVLQERTRRLFGDDSPAVFADPENLDGLIRRYMVNAQLESGAVSGNVRGSAALTLLQSSGLGQRATTNLFTSLL